MNIWKNFNQQYAEIYRFARRILCNHENAEDVTQEAILRYVRDKAGKLDGKGARKWIFVVVRNLCLSKLRRKSKFAITPLDDNVEACVSNPTPFDKALKNERDRQIENAIAELSFDMREIIILREYEGMNYKEISKFLSCPIGTVRSKLARARAELKKSLAPLMED